MGAIPCPACRSRQCVPFLPGEPQPLATLGWPKSADEARAMPRLPVDFVRCAPCGHVFGQRFDYDNVPYQDHPNRMFNGSARWSLFLQDVLDRLSAGLGPKATVVEIGYGDASFLHALRERIPQGRFVGFDPHGAADVPGLDLRAELFVPATHLEELRPDLIIARHVLEHLTNPLDLLQALSVGAARAALGTRAYIEVPCIDRALATGRTTDFFYEHVSQFTTESFAGMLERAGFDLHQVGHGYDGEVVFAHASLVSPEVTRRLSEADAFSRAAASGHARIVEQLAALAASDARVAIWGGTGKSAAFINRHGVDAERFPLVVDSDPAKLGTFVPGTGQVLRSPDELASGVDVVIIPPQWRAADIVTEMERRAIPYRQVLIEHDGQLVDFIEGDHPYAR